MFSRIILKKPIFQNVPLAYSLNRSVSKLNTGILFVPQQNAYVIERFGRFQRVLKPGLNFCIPFIDRIAYIQLLKELAIDIPKQSAITSDNVVLNLNGVLYLKIVDPYASSYGVEDAEFAVTQLAQTTMRSELGKISLDSVFKEREVLNTNIVLSINKATEPWGIQCLRYEIKDINLPEKIQEAMQLQVEAERKKRAAILESEGIRQAEINSAEARKRRCVLESEGIKIENINRAEGESQAMLLVAEAKAESIRRIAKSMSEPNGENAVQYNVAENYIKQFGQMARTNNTMLISANASDVSSMVAQAMTIYKAVNNNNNNNNNNNSPPSEKNSKRGPVNPS